MKVSMVLRATDTACEMVDDSDVIQAIRDGFWQDDVKKIRDAFATGGKKAANDLKKALPGVLWSGVFYSRANDALDTHSGLICADLDDLRSVALVRDQIAQDPHVYAAFDSPTGSGLKVVFRCDNKRPHIDAFNAAQAFVKDRFGLEVDKACKDVARLCFVSWDPVAVYNPNAEPIPYTQAEPRAPVISAPPALPRNDVVTADDVRELLRFIPSRPEYSEWLRIASAVWDVLPMADGCTVLNEWSPEEKPGEYTAKWRTKLENVHFGTLVHLAKQGGYVRTPAMRAKQIAQELEKPDPEAALQTVLERALALEIDPANPPSPDDPIFYVAGKLCSTSGNLSSIVARAKTGKTSVVGAHIAACLVAEGMGNNEADTLGIRSEPTNGKAVVLIDTEQSPSHACKLIERSLARAGLGVNDRPKWLRAYPLAGWQARELAAVLPALLKHLAEEHGGIHAAFIDGGADFAINVNDPEEAAKLCGDWHALAIKHHCALVAVIHANEGDKADDMARGWLGKQLRRKAESNLQLKRDGDITKLFGESGQRHAPIFEREGPAFKWDDATSMHVSVTLSDSSPAKLQEARALAAEVFQSSPRLRWKALFDGIMEARGCVKSTAEKRIKEMESLGVIRTDGMGFKERVL